MDSWKDEAAELLSDLNIIIGRVQGALTATWAIYGSWSGWPALEIDLSAMRAEIASAAHREQRQLIDETKGKDWPPRHTVISRLEDAAASVICAVEVMRDLRRPETADERQDRLLIEAEAGL